MSTTDKPPFGCVSSIVDSRLYPLGIRWELLGGDYNRALACIAACAGMSDPEAYVADLRETSSFFKAEYDALLVERDALRAERDALREALEAVIGHGYSETKSPASQDYVSKSAIAKARAALARSNQK